MASPWVCSTCRTRLPSIVRGVRGVSQHAARRQGIGAVQETYGRDGTMTGGSGGGGGGNGSVRGRYSGREIRTEMLRPETVLHQLDKETPRVERTQRRDRNHQAGRGGEGGLIRYQGDTRSRDGGVVHPRQAKLPGSLIRDTDAFMAAVTADNLPLAWSLLKDQITPALHKIPFPPRKNWMRKALVLPKLNEFRRKCTQAWLSALQTASLSTHALPPTSDLVLLIEQLGFSRSVFHRPSLWELAAGINHLRLANTHTQPAIDLTPGVEELMKLWRLCHFVAIKRARSADDDPSLRDFPADWSFLPPLTIFATIASNTRDLDGLLSTIVYRDKGDPTDAGRNDYTSPALVTLDLLRTTQCEIEDGRMGVCADLADYGLWVKLMETLLKSASPVRVPPYIQQEIVAGSDDLRERYCRLLRRVGMRSAIVEAEMKSAIYRRDVKDDSASSMPMPAVEVEEASSLPAPTPTTPPTTTPPTTTPTSEDVTSSLPQGEEEEPPRTTPHIKFTTPPDNPHVEQFALLQITRLGRALEKSDIHQAERIRKNVGAFASSNHLTPTALPIEVYEHLMMVLFALKQPKSAVEVWQRFTQDGYVPTVKTYTVLMQGASRAHDVTTMEKFWNALRHQAKLQPDSHAWSTRINGLFSAKANSKGLAALSEMGKEWYTAARNAEYVSAGIPLPQPGKKNAPSLPEPSLSSLLAKYPSDVDGTPRPGLVVMNTAVAALASSYYDSEIPKVLHWGRTFQIEPDLITYNALLNICMRHSQGEQALSLLVRMREKGIQADSTTWTVLLTALFQSGFLDNLAHEEQGQRIMDFIRSVEAEEGEEQVRGKGGLDVKGYALIIDRLLKVHQNEKAAAEVLRYMVHDAHLRPTAQIYTILMTSYFFPAEEGKGPDWRAIDTLWTQISTPDQKGFTPGLDPIFFDRMVEGYALHHEVVGMKPAMDFLARMSERGMRPGFGALEAVARMLARRGEWDVLKRLVAEVRKRDPGRKGVMYQRQRAFWEFVVGTGVMGEEGLEDVLGGRRRGHWMDG